jgi:hypothetical protein
MVGHVDVRAVMAAKRVELLLTEFTRLDDNLELNRAEVAVLVNREESTLKAWAKDPNHPIKWRLRGKQVSTTVRNVRQFLRTGEMPKMGRPRVRAATATAADLTTENGRAPQGKRGNPAGRLESH